MNVKYVELLAASVHVFSLNGYSRLGLLKFYPKGPQTLSAFINNVFLFLLSTLHFPWTERKEDEPSFEGNNQAMRRLENELTGREFV